MCVAADAVIKAPDAIGVCSQCFGGRDILVAEARPQFGRKPTLQSPSLGPFIAPQNGDQADEVRVVPGKAPVLWYRVEIAARGGGFVGTAKNS